uniref:NADH-ubiquinone oxidoreductase chain 4 n=1 Tax=Porcellio dilatatus petiti TaxID=96811 RepID=A0A1P8DKH4_PORDI|nr:NADH dehydrogenase subunit 4 [Porcellio dilatatus petiti]
MMKVLIILIMPLIFPLSLISFSFFMALMLLLLAFFSAHNQDFFLLYKMFSWDTLSMSLVSLTLTIVILMALSSLSNKTISKSMKPFTTALAILLILLVGTFSTSNLLLFYILFEASLLPTFALILGWGNQPERLQAGMYMLIYTILASLPLLVTLLIWSNSSHSTSLLVINMTNKTYLLTSLLAVFLILAFSVKLPVYMVHLWLPKAHVEAPVAGSMILAAILLKLGGYGLLRVSSKAHPIIYSLSSFSLSWSLTGGALIAIICLTQTDIKFLIALSSVAHMALVMASVMTFSAWGINSAQFIMIGHGFCSSGLFFLANMIYERMNSRSLLILKGLQTFLPSFSIMWFLMCTSNMAAPPTLNLLGEISGISSVFSWSLTLALPLMLLVFLAAAYSLFLYNQSQHGKPQSTSSPMGMPSLREWLISSLHWAPLNLFFLAPWTIQMIMWPHSLYKMLSCGLKEVVL